MCYFLLICRVKLIWNIQVLVNLEVNVITWIDNRLFCSFFLSSVLLDAWLWNVSNIPIHMTLDNHTRTYTAVWRSFKNIAIEAIERNVKISSEKLFLPSQNWEYLHSKLWNIFQRIVAVESCSINYKFFMYNHRFTSYLNRYF